MKQMPNQKRSRNFRGNGRRPNFQPRNSTFESSGPEGKIRGSAHQVIDKYQALARDALAAGDRIAAENYLQHAEHYYRVLVASGIDPRPNRGPAEQPLDGEDAGQGEAGAASATRNQPSHEPESQPVG
ncbi:MAG: DUF4167 domain-containing protein [Alphaproteobacteria bacterium]